MKYMILACATALITGLTVVLWPKPADPCQTAFSAADRAASKGYHGDVLVAVGALARLPKCRGALRQKAVALAAEARLFVPEVNGTERAQHMSLLRRLSGPEFEAQRLKSTMQALLSVGDYGGALAAYLDAGPHQGVQASDADWLALAAARGAADQRQTEAIAARLLGGEARPFARAYLSTLLNRPDAGIPAEAAALMRSTALRQSPAPALILWALEHLDEDDLVLLTRLLVAAGANEALWHMADHISSLSTQMADVLIPALWDQQKIEKLLKLRPALAADTWPDTRLYLCLATLQARAGEDCNTLLPLEDLQRRFGRPYMEQWAHLFGALPEGPAGYVAALNALNTIDRYGRPSRLRPRLAALLYNRIGESDLSAMEAARADRWRSPHLATEALESKWAKSNALKSFQALLDSDERIDADMVALARSESPKRGLIWRQLAVKHYLAQGEAGTPTAIVRLREIVEEAPERSDSHVLALLRLSSLYLTYGDRAAARRAVLTAVDQRTDILPLVYGLTLSQYRAQENEQAAEELVTVWHHIAWREGLQGTSETANAQPKRALRPVVDRLSHLLRVARNSADPTLQRATCHALQRLVGQLPVCAPFQALPSNINLNSNQ